MSSSPFHLNSSKKPLTPLCHATTNKPPKHRLATPLLPQSSRTSNPTSVEFENLSALQLRTTADAAAKPAAADGAPKPADPAAKAAARGAAPPGESSSTSTVKIEGLVEQMLQDFGKWLDENISKDPRMAGDLGSVTIILNKSQWEAKLEEAKTRRKIVVTDFNASWCGPCRIMGPKFVELSKKYENNLIFLKVDVDEVSDVTTEWEIRAMPTFVFIKDCKQIDKVVGANLDELEQKIHHYATNQSILKKIPEKTPEKPPEKPPDKIPEKKA